MRHGTSIGSWTASCTYCSIRRALERAKNSGQFNSAQEVLESTGLNYELSGRGGESGSPDNVEEDGLVQAG